MFSYTVPQGQVWPKIIEKLDAKIFSKFFFKIFFCMVKKRILENICKIWHLPIRNRIQKNYLAPKCLT
jgi:hypothetical protein